MHLIIYTSEYIGRGEDIDDVLADIVSRSKINNSQHDITGLLFYHGRRFIQVLEGSRDSLEGLMSILEQDHRHQNIERIVDQEIKKRAFQEWSMDALNLSEDATFDPDELIRIRDAYKKHLLVDSRLLVEFYKAMLALGSMRQQ
ncbi:MAG: BLUF domain-containing protein [Arenicellales bacterium]